MKTKKNESKEIVFWMFLAAILFIALMFASVSLAAERVVTIADGDNTWKMTISPRSSQPALLKPVRATPVIVHTSFEQESDGKVPAAQAVPPLPEAPPKKAKPLKKTEHAENESPCVTPGCSQYDIVYRSIPFRRSEYLANPSYRHEATMELLFGQLRPTVIQKLNQPRYEGAFPEPVPYGRSYRRTSRLRYTGQSYRLAPYYNRYYSARGY